MHLECDFPVWGQYLLSSYMLLMLTLFTNFYIHAYIMKRRSGKQDSSRGGDGVAVNLTANDYTNGPISDNVGAKKRA